MHDPIYPAHDQAVTYTLVRASGPKLLKVELYASVASIDTAGAVTCTQKDSLLDARSSPGDFVRFTYDAGYPDSSLVRYRFVVRTRSGLWPFTRKYSQSVAFATQPYPVLADPELFPNLGSDVRAAPAPVYAVGDDSCTFDVVLIPDQDLTVGITDETDVAARLDSFRQACGTIIREVVKGEPALRVFRRAFNFYINPLPGTAVSNPPRRQTVDDGPAPEARRHEPPMNACVFTTYEVRVLLHRLPLGDSTPGDVPCAPNFASADMEFLGTFRHEFGHACFGLADEFTGGDYGHPPSPYPNTWADIDGAQAAARERRIPRIPTGFGNPRWYKLCGSECQMANTGVERKDFDRPCRDRILYRVMEVARSHAPSASFSERQMR